LRGREDGEIETGGGSRMGEVWERWGIKAKREVEVE
jgi:hypothetical protein